MRHVLQVVILLLCCVSAIAQKRTDAAPVSTIVHGRIMIDGRSAPQGIRVSLELGGSVVGETTTDNSGNFEFRGMNSGLFDCIVSQPGFRTAREIIDLRTATTAYTMIELKPKPDANGPNIPPEGPGSMMSVKTANLPAEALKHFQAGEKTFASGKNLDEAVASFKKATEIAPNFSEAFLMMGMAELGCKRFEAAEKTFTRAISLDAASAPALVGLAEARNSLGKFDQARATLSQALHLSPDSPEAHYELAKSLWGLKRWEEAEPHAVRSIALKPDYPDAHVMLGNILLRKRDAAGALREFQEYLRLAPQGSMADPTRQVVSKLQTALQSSSPH
jgi:Flp pilus assembly protein TadD